MLTMKNLFFRALLALTIAAGAPAALAGPLYRVALDTSALAGTTGYLELALNGVDFATPAVAHAGNFSGAFLDGALTQGDVSGDVASGITLRNGPEGNFFNQLVSFGGLFSFDVSLDAGAGDNGTLFSVAFTNAAYEYLGALGNVLELNIVAGAPVQLQLVESSFAQVDRLAEVPEPGEWLLLATGLLLLAAMRRMRRR